MLNESALNRIVGITKTILPKKHCVQSNLKRNMSGGLKMPKYSEISPSKDNLIFSSMEDLQIHSIDLETSSPNKKPSSATTAAVLDLDYASKEKLTRNNSLNITKSKSKVKTHQRNLTQDHIQVLPDPDSIFQAKRQHQHNLILVQQQQQHQQKSILRNGGGINNEGKIVGGGGDDQQKIDYEMIEELDGQTVNGDNNGGPRVVEVDEEVDGRSSCCWGFRVRT